MVVARMTVFYALIESHRLAFIVAAFAAMLLFVFSYETADGTAMIPSQGIEMEDGHDAPEGIWSDGTTMWVSDDCEDKLIAYNVANGNRRESEDIDLASYNSSPQGIWSDGTIMWVVDWDDEKLYAYNLDSGRRQSSRDISLDNNNSSPRGLWGSGGSIYVVDKDDTYIYVYGTADGARHRSQEFDLDGSISNLTWQWQAANSNPTDTWTDISGATSASYTPVAADAGKYLRAMASYDDGEGTGKEAFGDAANSVEQPSNEPPEFDEGAGAVRSVSENAASGTLIRAAVTASDPDGDTLTYSMADSLDPDLFTVASVTGKLSVASGAAQPGTGRNRKTVTLRGRKSPTQNWRPTPRTQRTKVCICAPWRITQPVKVPTRAPREDRPIPFRVRHLPTRASSH